MVSAKNSLQNRLNSITKVNTKRMAFVFFLIFSISKSSIYGQVIEKEEINSSIKNSVGKYHQNFEGTGMYMIIPPGYKKSNEFIGFYKNEETIIIGYETYLGPEVTDSLTAGNELSDSLKIISKQEIKVNGYPGWFVIFENDEKQLAYGITFGNSRFRMMVTATLPKKTIEEANEIIKAFNSIAYEIKNRH